MHVECPTCGMLVNEEKYSRCPRCHTNLKLPSGCSGCHGCSIKGLCPSKKQKTDKS